MDVDKAIVEKNTSNVASNNTVKDTNSDAASENLRETFLASFTAAEDKKIMRKVDQRFLLLIGLMYMLKNIDYNNAASVKVLQVGKSRNILKELHMTADQYNWVQSIYFVCRERESCLQILEAYFLCCAGHLVARSADAA